MKPIHTAVIGGSGLYDIPGAEIIEELQISTPFGKTSDTITVISFEGQKAAFLPRHGKGHVFNPSEIPVRANIYALKTIGVNKIIAISAVGSLKEEIPPEDFVIPDQIIDRTKNRPSTFFENGIVGHISFGDPFCQALSKAIAEPLTNEMGKHFHAHGTYVCMEGPAFSTRAESNLYRNWGASVIGMTALPEAKLAREAEMCYTMIAMSTDYDCWRQNEESVTIDMIIGHMQKNTARVKQLLPKLLIAAEKTGDCPCRTSAATAIFTAKDKITPEAKERLSPLYGKYLG